MKPVSIIFLIGIFLTSFNVTTCLAQKRLTQEMIDEYGTKTFSSDKTKMMEIVKSILSSHGYTIEFEQPSKGLIKTGRKDIGGSATASFGTYSGTAVYRSNYRQYYITVTEVGDGNVKVIITPKVYIGEGDVSDQKIWVLKGASGEYKLWEGLFKEIGERL